eukprot:CAMPEP_0202383234 /NCGR_PEP_ID=MMETSP1127-20130417/48007_1 /ASSEMBLY_ACC=CAM_ASM_000462 /TAXON_ID=3047 /ORGANISM="Dunaliella tertiolecta, Strain CCMP1320" /LENGTH=438 /DNA_ID=CAMNT_0048982665 /DNA_START=122 /DNA_END=1434 /DNA_ORIENTATION=+
MRARQGLLLPARKVGACFYVGPKEMPEQSPSHGRAAQPMEDCRGARSSAATQAKGARAARQGLRTTLKVGIELCMNASTSVTLCPGCPARNWHRVLRVLLQMGLRTEDTDGLGARGGVQGGLDLHDQQRAQVGAFPYDDLSLFPSDCLAPALQAPPDLGGEGPQLKHQAALHSHQDANNSMAATPTVSLHLLTVLIPRGSADVDPCACTPIHTQQAQLLINANFESTNFESLRLHNAPHPTFTHAASPPGTEVAKKASRTQMTPLQKEVLEASYTLNPFPPAEHKRSLGERIGLDEKQISTWFSSRRRKDKKTEDSSAGPASAGPPQAAAPAAAPTPTPAAPAHAAAPSQPLQPSPSHQASPAAPPQHTQQTLSPGAAPTPHAAPAGAVTPAAQLPSAQLPGVPAPGAAPAATGTAAVLPGLGGALPGTTLPSASLPG